jgi:hypothetical protein
MVKLNFVLKKFLASNFFSIFGHQNLGSGSDPDSDRY